MREIIFRGKRIDNGEWAYGYYTEWSAGATGSVIETDDYDHSVDPETVGQYTGLQDKNGKEIYEGDIVRRTCDLIGAEHDGLTGIVIYECAMFMLESFDGKDGRGLWDDVQELEVLGNIYEFPELCERR